MSSQVTWFETSKVCGAIGSPSRRTRAPMIQAAEQASADVVGLLEAAFLVAADETLVVSSVDQFTRHKIAPLLSARSMTQRAKEFRVILGC